MSDFFEGVAPIRYEGPRSDSPFAFRWYDADRVVAGRTMLEVLRGARFTTGGLMFDCKLRRQSVSRDDLLDGEVSLHTIHDELLANNIEPAHESGRQELVKGLVARHIERVR
jgi:xylose isomerase